MSKMWILQKKNEITHTYSQNKRAVLKAHGWVEIASVSGWNMSIVY